MKRKIIHNNDRQVERDTVMDLRVVFEQQNRKVHENIYQGNKSVMIIYTEKYKLATSF